MTKKKINRLKHQKDVADTSEDELNDSSFQGKTCPHVSKAVNFGRVKKIIKTGDLSSCSGCTEPASEELEIWLCLQCGYRGCGRTSTEKHGLQHFKTIHSDCHSLVLSLLSGDVWCYDCDDGVQLQQSKNLKQCVEFILKLRTNNNKPFQEKDVKKNSLQEKNSVETKVQSISKNVGVESISPKSGVKSDVKSKKSSSPFMPSVKGLRNLGNTCYFNAVMQNLSQTHLLFSILEEICAPEYKWEVPRLVVVKDTVVEDPSAETLKVTLPKEFQLVHSLLLFLTKMCAVSQNKSEVINPDDLFKNLQKKAPQFQNYLQQDSHELLRQFLDGIRQEEMKRHKKAILRHFNITNINPENIDDETKKLIKAYGYFANHTVVDRIFGGLLISTVLCEECKMSSQVFEPFMDMSLPLFEEKQESSDRPLLDGGKQDKTKPLRNRKSDVDVDEDNEFVLNKSNKDYSKPSKYQEKKMRQLEKKEKKKLKKNMKRESSEALKRAIGLAADGRDDRDADDALLPGETEPIRVSVSGCAERPPDEEDAPPRRGGEEEEDVALVLFGEEVRESEGSDAGAEAEGDDRDDFPFADEAEKGEDADGSEDLDAEVPPEGSDRQDDDPDGDRPAGELPDHLVQRMHALGLMVTELRIRRDSDRQDSLLSGGSSRCSSAGSSPRRPASPAAGGEEEEEGLSHDLQAGRLREWVLKSLSPLRPRPAPAPLECSVDSCLAHFTKPELLAGNNKFRCESCSQIRRRKTGDKKSVVYSNASKQLLVFSPPAILTLHLKRFQQVSMSLRKVNRFVEFPMILDLAPYCSSACTILPHVSSASDEILYSLYGVVEHSGHLRSGHYTAFVKLRGRATPDRSFLCQLPLAQCDLEQMLRRFSESADPGPPPRDPGCADGGQQWFYVSDGHVREASEAQVLKCQAYLLFYERIQ